MVEAVFNDLETAPVDEKLRAMLRFLEKMTVEPAALSRTDGVRLFEAGLNKKEIEDAIKVGFAFNLIVRLADSFDFEVPSDAHFAKGAKMITKVGYKM